MTVKTIGKTKLALGLEWNPLTDANLKKEAEALAGKRKKPLGAIYSDSSIGIAQVALTDDKKHSGAIAAAAALALVFPNVLIVQATSKDHVWVCFVQDGQVIIGYDFVAKKEDAKRILNDFLESEEEIDPLENCEVIADKTTSNFLFDIVKEEPKVMTLEDALGSSELSFPKDFSSLRIKPLKSSSLLLVGGTVAAVVAAGYFYMNGQNVQPEPEPMDMGGLAALNQPVEPPPPPPEPEMTKEDIINLAIEEEAYWLQEIFKMSEANHVINQTLNNIDFTNLSQSGWNLGSVGFTGNEVNTTLNATWVKSYGQPVDFKETFGDRSEIDLSGDFGVVHLDFNEKQLTNSPKDFLEYLKNQKLSIEEIMTGLNKLPVVWTMAEEEVNNRPEIIEDLVKVDKDLASLRQIPQRWLSVRVTGNTIKSLRNSGMLFEKSGNISLRTLTIDLTDGISWELRGRIYEL